MIVVDANCLIYFACVTPFTKTARQLRECDAEWIVPKICEAEVLNGLVTMHRAEKLSLSDVIEAWRKVSKVIQVVEEVDPELVLQVAKELRLTAYDAYYVALAVGLEIPLVTEDKKVCRACPQVARSIQEHLNFPGGFGIVREVGEYQSDHPTLEEMMAKVAPENIHGEIDMGMPAGALVKI